jgi:hypothetical protein
LSDVIALVEVDKENDAKRKEEKPHKCDESAHIMILCERLLAK